jgi:hypothetical protein
MHAKKTKTYVELSKIHASSDTPCITILNAHARILLTLCPGYIVSNKGDKYCTMCATPHPKRQAVLAAHATDFVAPAAVVAAPMVVDSVCTNAKGSHWHGHVVAKKAKALKESAPAMLDKSAVC